MKKITLLAVVFLMAVAAKAQETSFESSDGYDLGEINGQNGWQASDDLSDLFVISEDQVSDGNQALKLSPDENGLITGQSVGGPTHSLDDLTDNAASITVQADVYGESISNADAYQMIMVLGHLNQNNELEQVGYLSFYQSTQQGQDLTAAFAVNPFDTNQDTNQDLAIISADTYVNFKMQVDLENDEITYFANGAEVYSYTRDAGLPSLDALAFFTSGDNTYHIDNVRTDIETLGFDNPEAVGFEHYTDNGFLNVSANESIEDVQIFNMLGQNVASKDINSNSGQVALSSLSSGVYISKVTVNGQTKSFKFVK